MYTEMTLKEFMGHLASRSPAPGGGSVSALAGSLSAALTAMVARFSAGRKSNSKELEQQIEQNLQVSLRLQRILQEDVDQDTAAYNRVVDAYRMPKGTAVEKKVRSRAIQEALRGATQLPLQVAQRSLEVLEVSFWALAEGNPNTWSDAVVAVLMAQSGIEGALANVAINLDGIKDAVFKKEMTAQAGEIRRKAQHLREKMGDLLGKRLA